MKNTLNQLSNNIQFNVLPDHCIIIGTDLFESVKKSAINEVLYNSSYVVGIINNTINYLDIDYLIPNNIKKIELNKKQLRLPNLSKILLGNYNPSCIKGRTFNSMYLFLDESEDWNEWLVSNFPCISSSNGKLRIIIKDDSLLPILPDYFIHRVSNGN